MLSWETRASCARKNSQGRSLEMLESSFLISLNTSSSNFRGICGGWVVSGLQGHMGLNPLHLGLEVKWRCGQGSLNTPTAASVSPSVKQEPVLL